VSTVASLTEVRKRKMSGIAKRVFVLLLMLILVGFFVFPMWFMIVTSFKPNTLAVRDMSSIMAFVPRFGSPEVPVPEDWTLFHNYATVLRRQPVPRLYFNAFLIAGLVVTGRLAFDSLAAYSLARLKWKGKGIVLAVIISLIIIPFEAIAIPLLLMVNLFGWVNSYTVQIVPFMSSPLAIFLFYQFFLNFPSGLEDAAKIDGASHVRTFVSIVAPMGRGAYVTVAILGFLEIWSSFLWPLIVTRDSTYRPVILGLFFFFGDERLWGNIMAYSTVVVVPVLAVFLVFQRWFEQSIASSGLKG
jgi:multiple sugar transport system permease protein